MCRSLLAHRPGADDIVKARAFPKVEAIPKTIWTYWQQGNEAAPYVVRKCIDSWADKNPGWRVVVLDARNLAEHVPAQLLVPAEVAASMSPNHFSDLLRVAVLQAHGGVWADATVFCTKPLDEWLDVYGQEGFFAFRNPGKDRLMASWFLASSRGCPLTVELCRRFRSYWIENNFAPLTPGKFKWMRVLTKTFGQTWRTTRFWFNPLISKVLKVYPYFVFHYTFERVVSTDRASRAIWQGCPSFQADGPLLLDRLGFFSEATTERLRTVSTSDSPVFKLSWKIDQQSYQPGTLLYWLLESRSTD